MNIFLIDFENVSSKGLNGINRLRETDQVIIFYSENADSMTFDLHEQINTSRAYIFFQKVDVGIKNALDFQLATYLGYLIGEKQRAGEDVVYYLISRDHGYASLVTYWTKRGIDITLVGSLASSKIIPQDKDEDGVLQESDAEEAGASEDAAGGKGKDKEKSKDKEKDKDKDKEKKNKGKGGSKSGSRKKNKDSEKEEEKEAVQEAEEEEEEKPAKSDGAKKTKSEKKTQKKKEESPEEKALRLQVEQVVPDQDVVDLVVSYIQKYKTKLGINNALAKEFKDSKKASEIYKSIKPLIANKKGQ